MHPLSLSYIGALLSLLMTDIFAQSLDGVTSRECVYGDCADGRGRLEPIAAPCEAPPNGTTAHRQCTPHI